MWTRNELKHKAKEALQRNYWKVVLVTLLAVTLGGGFSAAAVTSGGSGAADNRTAEVHTEYPDGTEPGGYESIPDTGDGIINRFGMLLSTASEGMDDTEMMIFRAAMVIILVIVFLFVWVLMYARVALLCNPFYTGVCRFMLKSINDRQAEVKEIAYGFDHSYKNVVKTMFHTDIRIFGWALLFIIPGIYKKYQYCMVPYILAENPGMNYKEVLRMSSDIMNGEKWHVFVLDLSFILWHILGIITCGIAELLYVSPYLYLTRAALYRRLCELCNERQQTLS